MNEQVTVFVVDDDRAVRESLALLVQSVGLEVETFSGAGEFLDAYQPDLGGCLITDIRMPGMSGLELQERLTEQGYHIPVIVLTGFGDVPAAVRALKGGAVDFVEKPFNPQALLDLVQQALARDAELREQAAREADLAEHMALLTPREREVMALVVAGRANKVIAIDPHPLTGRADADRAATGRRQGELTGPARVPWLFRIPLPDYG